jgi:hypothetical protein
MTIAARANKLTPHQKYTLVRFARRSRGNLMRDSDFGCKGALAKLAEKGLLVKNETYGPRGGFITLYVLNETGQEVADYIRTHNLKTWR